MGPEFGMLAILSNLDMDWARGLFGFRYWMALAAAKYGAPFIRPGGPITLTLDLAGARQDAGWSVASGI
jgi:hypothetical protein